eukprot:206437_1
MGNKHRASLIESNVVEIGAESVGYRNRCHTSQCRSVYKHTKTILVGNNTSEEMAINFTNCYKQINDITHIHSGLEYTIYCNHNTQKYYSAGRNYNGQCGVDHVIIKTDKQTRFQSARVDTIPFTEITFFQINNIKIKKVCTNVTSGCTFWITQKNQIYGHGINIKGTLGIGNNKSQFTPFLIHSLRPAFNVVDIKSNLYYSVALCRFDTRMIVLWYSNNLNIADDIVNTIIKFYGSKAISRIYVTGNRNNIYKQFSSNRWKHMGMFDGKDIIKIDCKSLGFYLLESTGLLYFCVDWDIEDEIICYSLYNKKIKDVSCGSDHVLIIDHKYKIYSWGNNVDHGQCGHPIIHSNVTNYIYDIKRIKCLKKYKIIKIKCGSLHSYAMSDDGKHFLFGSNHNSECLCSGNPAKPHLVNIGSKNIKYISLGVMNTKILFNVAVNINKYGKIIDNELLLNDVFTYT